QGASVQQWRPLPAPIGQPKASLNTATFAELFRAFWNVMADTSAIDSGPFASDYKAIFTNNPAIYNWGANPPQTDEDYYYRPPVPAASSDPVSPYPNFYDPYVGAKFRYPDPAWTMRPQDQ